MSLHLLGIVILCSILLGLAALVLAHNREAYVNKLFAFSMLTIAGWITSISLALTVTALDQTVALGRFAFAFATVMPFTLLSLFSAFPASKIARPSWPLRLFGLACAAFAILSFTPWVVTGAARGDLRPNFIYGPLHPYLGLYAVACLAWALVVLSRKLRSATGIQNLQLRYLLLGVLLGGLGVITTNLVIPVIWRTSRYSVVGPYFTLVFASFAAHAIVRHRLMDIRVFVKKGVVYGLAISVVAAMFASLAFAVATLTGQPHDAVPLNTALAMAILISILFQPLKSRLQTALNRYLYRHTYDYQRIVRETSRTLNSTLELKQLLSHLAEVVDTTLTPELLRVYLKTDPYRTFEEFIPHNAIPAGLAERDLGSPNLILSLEAHRSLLYADNGPRTSDATQQAAITELRHLGGELAFPFVSGMDLLGFILLGPKRSGDPYFTEDLDLVSTLVSQASIGIRNAQLYSEILLANEYIENILSTMDSAVIAVSAEGFVSLFNSAAERMTQLPASAVKGTSFHRLPPQIADPLQATINDGGGRVQLQTSIPGGAGQITPVMCSTSTLKDKIGRVLGAVGVFSDLSNVKQLESEKRRAERLASSGALASGIAHEIKNPLVAIRTFAELLPERFKEVDFREDFSKVVIAEIDRLDGLVARLRGIAAPFPQVAGPVDIRRSIVDTLILLRAQLEQSHTMVRREFEHPTPVVAVDDGQLKQLFLNILLNGIEAMGAGGELTIKISGKERHDTSWVVVEVSDTGPGIPESIKVHIFEPFFSTKTRGSGLGLAICRGITDAHRGTIRAENSASGRGTTIIVEFPAAGHSLQRIQETAATGSQNS